MIRTVIFDLGGVIVPLDFPSLYSAIAERCPLAAADIPECIASTGLVPELECGRVSPEEFERVVGQALKLALPADGFGDLWGRLFTPPATIVPERLIRSIGEQKRLVLLSNTNGIHFPYILRHYPWLDLFDATVLSHEVGAMKPDPAMYHEAVRQAGCPAGECFFIDDLEENIDAARREGLDAEQFVSVERLEQHLRQRGIPF